MKVFFASRLEKPTKCKRGTFLGAMFRGFTYPFENGNKQTQGVARSMVEDETSGSSRKLLAIFLPQKHSKVQVKII